MDTLAGYSPFTLLIAALVVFAVAYLMGALSVALRYRARVRDIRLAALKKQRAVVGGQVSEQLAPYFPDFPFKPSEARFLGKPVDLLVFVGMDRKHIEKVVFVEVKTGRSGLSQQEKHLREAIEAGRVEYHLYRRECA